MSDRAVPAVDRATSSIDAPLAPETGGTPLRTAPAPAADAATVAADTPTSDSLAGSVRVGIGAALAISAVMVAAIARSGLWRGLDGRWRMSLFDDAMISMSYARTAAGGDGLLWYPGAEPVEGITNLGWTAVMVLLHRIGLGSSAVAAVMILVGVGCVWIAALCGRRLVRSVGLVPDGAPAAFCAVAAIAASFPLLYWTVRGMEVGAMAMLSVVACAAAHRLVARGDDPRRIGVAAALVVSVAAGVVVRHDFLVVAGALCVWLLWSREHGLRRRVAALVVAGAAGALVAVTAFRLAQYGAVVPNTYQLKVEGIGLGTRLARGLAVAVMTAGPYLLAPLVPLVLAWRWTTAHERDLLRLVLILVGAALAYSTYVGGDAWEQFLIPNRYLSPAVALLTLVGVACAHAAWRRAPAETAEQRRHRSSTWSRAAVVIGAGPAAAAVASVVVVRATPGSGGLAPIDSDVLVISSVTCLLLGALVARMVQRSGSDSQAESRATRRAALSVSLLLLVVVSSRVGILRQPDGTRFSELGDHLAALTEPSATVAAAGVGGVQYWSERQVYDVLGKSDPVIAHSAPAAPTFIPGHDKYDAEHTVGRLRPDVVAQGIEAQELTSRGYVAVRSRLGPFTEGVAYRGEWVVFVRPDSELVRWHLLELVD